MRINMNKYSEGRGGFAGANGTVTGRLFLVGNPVTPLQAAPKQYVDAAVDSINSSSLVNGYIPVARLPAFTGEFSSVAGTNSLLLGPTGVTIGTYGKVTVDSKGRVTSGSALLDNDIPSLDWGKLDGNSLPNTLSEYGITDSLGVSGGTLTVFLTLHADPTSAFHTATKGYVDSALNITSGLSVGDVIRKPYVTTPSGFLKCNGAYVSQSTYSGLFAVIGNNYDTQLSGGFDYINGCAVGSGQPWKQQYNINTSTLNDTLAWGPVAGLPSILSESSVIVTKNRVYMLGGRNASVSLDTVYTAPINVDGTIGTWVTGTPLPLLLSKAQAVVTKSRVYLIGGYTNGAFQHSASVYTAPINADGTLGTWSFANSLPGPLAYSQAIVTTNRIYMLGGYSSAVVYTALIGPDGTIGNWTTDTSLPGNAHDAQAVVTKNRVYLLCSTIYTAPINADGTLGVWTTSGTLTVNYSYSQAVVIKDKVYLLGGAGASGWSNQVYIAPINADGTLGSWSFGSNLVVATGASQAIVTSSGIYLISQENGSGHDNTVVRAAFSGGLDDYSAYYDSSINLFDGSTPNGTTNPSPTTMFGLPDLTISDSNYPGSYTYIKI